MIEHGSMLRLNHEEGSAQHGVRRKRSLESSKSLTPDFVKTRHNSEHTMR